MFGGGGFLKLLLLMIAILFIVTSGSNRGFNSSENSNLASLHSGHFAYPSVTSPTAIKSMAPGTWLHYGKPWDDAAPATIPCKKRFQNIMDAWNGWTRDGLRYIYLAASGGHGDGCDNGVYRYDIQQGMAQLFVPHVPMNAGLDSDFPFVADTKGIQILPRSSHTYQGQYLEGPWLYLVTGSVHRRGSRDNQVWRFHTVKKNWERLPNRTAGSVVSMVVTTQSSRLLLGGWDLCEISLKEGTYSHCQDNIYFNAKSGVMGDSKRDGFWHVDVKNLRVNFIHKVKNAWKLDPLLSGSIPSEISTGISANPGICIVPDGSIIVFSGSTSLFQWNGHTWTTLSPEGAPPRNDARRVNTKWSWDDEAQACIGGTTTSHGLWIYKPVLNRERSMI